METYKMITINIGTGIPGHRYNVATKQIQSVATQLVRLGLLGIARRRMGYNRVGGYPTKGRQVRAHAPYLARGGTGGPVDTSANVSPKQPNVEEHVAGKSSDPHRTSFENPGKGGPAGTHPRRVGGASSPRGEGGGLPRGPKKNRSFFRQERGVNFFLRPSVGHKGAAGGGYPPPGPGATWPTPRVRADRRGGGRSGCTPPSPMGSPSLKNPDPHMEIGD